MLVRPVWLLYDDGRVYIRGAWGEETKWTRLDYENTKTRLDCENTKTRVDRLNTDTASLVPSRQMVQNDGRH